MVKRRRGYRQIQAIFSIEAHKQQTISLCYWNICSVTNKLENDEVIAMLNDYDVIWLSELKTKLDVHLPGFKCFRNTSRDSNHSGIGLSIRYNLVDQVRFIRFDRDDGICVSFTNMRSVVFGGCYIPTSSSSYFKESTFSRLNSRIKESNLPCIMLKSQTRILE